MKNTIITRFLGILFVASLWLPGVCHPLPTPASPIVVAAGKNMPVDDIEILSVTNDQGTTYVLTNKQTTCVVIKEKATGQTWKGTTNLQGLVTIYPGRALPEDTSQLEITIDTSCQPPGGSSLDSATLQGVVTFEIKTNDGRKVNLTAPADMRPGDTVSMSAAASDTASLQGIVFDVDGKKVTPRGNILTFEIPKVLIEARIITLKDSFGREIGRHIIPLNTGAPGGMPSGNFPYSPPRIGQTGGVISIPGKFDGIAQNTSVMFTPDLAGSSPTNLPLVAKSPRCIYASVPANAPVGPGRLTTLDNGVKSESRFNIAKLIASADRTKIGRGDISNAKFEIIGLQGVVEDQHDIILVVKNFTPSVIRFSSTNSNVMMTRLRPDKRGIAVFLEKLRGLMAGMFTVTGTISTNPTADSGKCKCVCELAKTPIVTTGTSKIDGGGMQHAFEANVAKAACNGNKCSIDKTEYSWSIGATSTATYTVTGAKKDGKTLKLDVTGAGTVVLTVTVTITCSEGTKCSATGSKTFTVDAK